MAIGLGLLCLLEVVCEQSLFILAPNQLFSDLDQLFRDQLQQLLGGFILVLVQGLLFLVDSFDDFFLLLVDGGVVEEEVLDFCLEFFDLRETLLSLGLFGLQLNVEFLLDSLTYFFRR